MKISIYLTVIIILGAILIPGCINSTEPNKEADKMEINELFGSPKFIWFDVEYKSYQPDQAITQQIQNEFDSDLHRFFFFVKPQCACQIPQKDFAYLIKTLREANISDSSIEIYSMANESYAHPYKNNFELNFLPAYYVMDITDTIPGFSISDTIDNIQKNYPDSIYTVEKLLLEGIKEVN